MDDKKKFEIEFDDDFDAWLADHDSKKPAQEKAVVPKPAAPKSAAPKPAASKPAAPKSVATDKPVNKDVPIGKAAAAPAPKPAVQKPAQPQRPVTQDISSKTDSSVSNGDIPMSRRETVRNFKLNIDESVLDEPEVIGTEPKNNDKAIYFAARQPSKAQIEHRRAIENARVEREKEEKQKRAKQRKKQSTQVERLRRTLNVIVILLTSLLCSIYIISCINDILALNRDDELVTVTIEKGETYDDILDKLKDSGLIKHKWFSKLVTTFRNFDEKTYINGIYYLTADMGAEGMLTEMYQQQTSDESVRLSFPEGWTIQQIFEKLDKNDVCPAEYLYEALAEVEFEYGFIKSVPKDNSRCYSLEGYFFPDTYDFFVSEKQNGMGENPNSVIRKFLANYEEKWSEVYEKRAQELGLTMDEVIIIASIIQKEAAGPSQMEDVSSVIHNRLNNPSSYPTLGCDSTKKYVDLYLSKSLGESKARAYYPGYDTNSTRSGLPVGPICNPGIDAIEAALNPADTDYYYFCHNNDGDIYLAETYSQFQANWAQVLKDNEE